MNSPLRVKNKRRKATKEAFFVRLTTPDDGPAFFNVTAHLGRAMPYRKPQATCAMRVEANTVAFSLLHLTKKAQQRIAEDTIHMPHGPLAKLMRQTQTIEDLADGTVCAEINGREHRFDLTVNDAGVASLEIQAGYGDGDDKTDDVTFELPFKAVTASVFLNSSAVQRRIAVGFIGHVGKPGTPETVSRTVAKVLNSISGLVEFRVLTGIETVQVPAAPSQWIAQRYVRRDEDKVVVEIPVYLFDTEHNVVDSGAAVVEIDLDNANATTGRLLYHITPAENIEEPFAAYRNICDLAITEQLRIMLGQEEIEGITFDVVLGDVGSGTIERLREAMVVFGNGIDLSPSQWKLHE